MRIILPNVTEIHGLSPDRRWIDTRVHPPKPLFFFFSFMKMNLLYALWCVFIYMVGEE